MRVVSVWRENSDYGQEVAAWLEDFTYQTGREIERLNPDTVEGEIFTTAYDVVEYPTLLALDSQGKVLASWRGLPLPLINEVVYYLKDT